VAGTATEMERWWIPRGSGCGWVAHGEGNILEHEYRVGVTAPDMVAALGTSATSWAFALSRVVGAFYTGRVCW